MNIAGSNEGKCKTFFGHLIDQTKLSGAVFASLLASLIVAVFSVIVVYWCNGLQLAEFATEANAIDPDILHTSLAGRVLFFVVQLAAVSLLLWPVIRVYKFIVEEDPIFGIFSVVGFVVGGPAYFVFLQITGWLMFNDKSMFVLDFAK